MIEPPSGEQPAPPVKNVNYFIEYSATPFAGRKLLAKSKSGLQYSSLGDFKIPDIKPGDATKLAQNITQRYSDGIMLDTDGLIGNICNWAHCQDVPAVDALQAIDNQINALGQNATDYQKQLQTNVQTALRTLKLTKII
ncbi:conserved hypothetical protein [Candidatus Roizmanbacteria bacterium]|nr:conserved hypothetical protein [Candidatus Roizmanbacteria bacterium]